MIATNLLGPRISTGFAVRPPAERSIANPISTGLKTSPNAVPEGESPTNTPILPEPAQINNTVSNSSQTNNSSPLVPDKLLSFLKRTPLKCKE